MILQGMVSISVSHTLLALVHPLPNSPFCDPA